MEDDKLEKLLKEISELWKSHCEAEDKLSTSLKKFRKEVNNIQKKTAKNLAQKILKKRNFNSGVQESIAVARSKLEKLALDLSDKDALYKVNACLDEGKKGLTKRQKHIMIATTSLEVCIAAPWP